MARRRGSDRIRGRRRNRVLARPRHDTRAARERARGAGCDDGAAGRGTIAGRRRTGRCAATSGSTRTRCGSRRRPRPGDGSSGITSGGGTSGPGRRPDAIGTTSGRGRRTDAGTTPSRRPARFTPRRAARRHACAGRCTARPHQLPGLLGHARAPARRPHHRRWLHGDAARGRVGARRAGRAHLHRPGPAPPRRAGLHATHTRLKEALRAPRTGRG